MGEQDQRVLLRKQDNREGGTLLESNDEQVANSGSMSPNNKAFVS